MRKHYYITLDTETTNTLDEPLVFDFGFAVHDKLGNIVEEHSLVIEDIFTNSELMSSAYYIDKYSQYIEDLIEGKRKMVSFAQAKRLFAAVCEKWGVDVICAYNIRFDVLALETTQRYLTKSKFRYFFPIGKIFFDTLALARKTVAKTNDYKAFCKENEYLTARHQPKVTAEIVYRYLTENEEFEESHTGLEDVKIENFIFATLRKWGVWVKPYGNTHLPAWCYCLRQAFAAYRGRAQNVLNKKHFETY